MAGGSKPVEDRFEQRCRDTGSTRLNNGNAANGTADTDIEVRCGHRELVECSSGELHVVEDRLADPWVDDGKDVA
jgi:hypothetical protein